MYFDEGGEVYDPELTGGDARVVGRLLDVGQVQDVATHGRHLVVGGKVGRGLLPPLDVGHGGPHGDAGQVDLSPEHDLVHRARRDRELRWQSTH